MTKISLSSGWWPRDLGFLSGWLMQADAGGSWRTGRLPSWERGDDLLYLKEQMEAEEDAERLLHRTEKRAFAAFKKAASLADSSPASVPLPLRVEPKPKSGIRQQDLIKNIVEIRPKRHRVSNESSPSSGNQVAPVTMVSASMNGLKESNPDKELTPSRPSEGEEAVTKPENPVKSLLGLAYETSDDEED
ncbi:uncharacterized protein LOC122080254 isoform X2 [Macadamia integrifolia]|uniref:uncharacterized protein LOC122080254 isoform X2 n=1 Tax=Macadamia integrifolia TaxID=60698 RepID=UPI001C4F14ED|nr:uncharacterized protein LOC122080254 isoform X2 [Macadamia integrifolia]XP_042503130.1 uncharacterized protein LOC122080254 isoform X2 [Macadamia integrifolia]